MEVTIQPMQIPVTGTAFLWAVCASYLPVSWRNRNLKINVFFCVWVVSAAVICRTANGLTVVVDNVVVAVYKASISYQPDIDKLKAGDSVEIAKVGLLLSVELPDFYLWSPYGIGQTIIFSCCGLFFFLLWSPYVIGRSYIFSSCFFFLLLFFPRLISAVGDWMSTILRHMVWS